MGICFRVLISSAVRFPKQPVSIWMMPLTLHADADVQGKQPDRLECGSRGERARLRVTHQDHTLTRRDLRRPAASISPISKKPCQWGAGLLQSTGRRTCVGARICPKEPPSRNPRAIFLPTPLEKSETPAPGAYRVVAELDGSAPPEPAAVFDQAIDANEYPESFYDEGRQIPGCN